jgi:pilus assembly protein TadC
MDNNVKLIESLIESTIKYGLAEVELVKLKTLDKLTDVVSGFVPHIIALIILVLFLVFFNFGLAFWLGDMIGNNFYGFFAIAAIHAIGGIIFHFFMHKRLKRKVSDYLVKQLFK